MTLIGKPLHIPARTTAEIQNPQALARRQRAEKNAKLNVTEAIAALAQQVSLESVDIRNQPTGRKRLDDFLDYAPPKDTALGRKKTARAKDKDAKADTLANYWRRDVEVSVRDNATFEAIYELMEKVERLGQSFRQQGVLCTWSMVDQTTGQGSRPSVRAR